jgi:hypothetical protein
MSRLYLSESGRVVPTLCEELTTYRRARKLLHLPPTSGPGLLYLLARPYRGAGRLLRLSVNGIEIMPIRPQPSDAYLWYPVPVEPALLRSGANLFEFWTDATAMNAWSLAVEAGHKEPASFTSDDGGATWRAERMGYLNVLRGEYVARVRLAEGQDPPPPPPAWEDPAHPRLERLRAIMPAQACRPGPLMGRVRALTSWLSSSWEHTSSGPAAQYAPWDVETILAWGHARSGHAGRLPIVFCVHYAVAFVSCCQAVGIPARCAAVWGTLNGWDGHFVAEVWFPEYHKWVMIDPNLDAVLWREGVPMSVKEIQEAGPDLTPLIEWGPGFEFQRRNPALAEWTESTYQTGLCFRHRSLWSRTDFLSHPELTPPGHGSTAYCETDLIWEERDLACGFGMFPYFGSAEYFEAPPSLPGEA